MAVMIIAILIARVCYLQIYDGEYYAHLADGNRIRIIPSMAPRGTFYDRNGQLLVSNRPGFSVSLLPLMEGTQGLFKRVIAQSGSVTLTYSKEECQNLTKMLL
ncbi:MAG: hypothetical protein IKG61_05880, partial [Selenomonadaceae bacterium]|nr:hypothetical protein [Selenomonadaceae bacterium]